MKGDITERIRAITLYAVGVSFIFMLIGISFDMYIVLSIVYNTTLLLGFVSSFYSKLLKRKSNANIIDYLYSSFLALVLCLNVWLFFSNKTHHLRFSWTIMAIFIILIKELFNTKKHINYKLFNPSQMFVFSFLFILIIGSLLLKLPLSTYHGIRFIDALFTSTSAVCVTGLSVMDTETTFTLFGQMIILFLIQIGGLGVMTFTSYLGYFVTGKTSFKSQLLAQELTSSKGLSSVFRTLKSIIVITFTIEILGALLIYYSTENNVLGTNGERAYFSIFHSISAFCNAGFSTLSGGLFDSRVRFNYSLDLIICFLIIFGGMGFLILQNLWDYLNILFKRIYRRLMYKERIKSIPWIISINSRIVLVTTSILLVFGTLSFFILEYNNILVYEKGLWGKLVTSFFASVTTRTAGFNNFDVSTLSIGASIIFLFLMWVGASSGSAGGGIKTSTFALAVMNFWTLIRGQNKVEISGREISSLSLKKAFAQIILSLIVINISVFLLAVNEEGKSILDIVFEVVSAFGTVGLSRGITSDLGDISKLALIVTMFIGRVSMFAILMSMIRSIKTTTYSYPKEDILIN